MLAITCPQVDTCLEQEHCIVVEPELTVTAIVVAVFVVAGQSSFRPYRVNLLQAFFRLFKVGNQVFINHRLGREQLIGLSGCLVVVGDGDGFRIECIDRAEEAEHVKVQEGTQSQHVASD